MNLGTLISASAAVLNLTFGVLFLFMSRAPGWAQARLFTLIAMTAGAYSAVNIIFAWDGVSPQVLHRVGVLNYFLAALHCACWLSYAFAPPDRPFSGLPRPLRYLAILLVGLGLVLVLPGVATTSGSVRVLEVPALGIVYRTPTGTPVADLTGVLFLLVLVLPFVRFVRAAWRREPGALTHVIGFTIFYLCALDEVLVSSGTLEFVYLGDIGFVAIVTVVLLESVRRIVHDARRLQAFGEELARQVEDRTAERDEARDALVHAERLAAMGQLASGVGHEINNPLTYVIGNLQLIDEFLAENDAPEDVRELGRDARFGAERIRRVVADLRAYVRPELGEQKVQDLAEVLRAAQMLASHQLRHVATLREEIDELAPVRADAVRLGQVFVNLLGNAAQAMEDAPRPDATVTLSARMTGEHEATIEIRDNGAGMPAEVLRRLGEPYFTTRAKRGGTGLGLFVARGIVAAMGGKLTAESTPGVGTTMRVVLPTLPRAATPRPSAPMPAQAPRPRPSAPIPTPAHPRGRVLVVDDDVAVARTVARLLAPFEIVVAHGGREALDLLGRDQRFDAILCDLMMPHGSGMDVHEGMAAAWPELLPRLVFMTGGAVTDAACEFLERDGVRCLMKPLDREAVEAAMSQILGRKR